MKKFINFSRILNLILPFVVKIVGIYAEEYPNPLENLIKKKKKK